MKQAVKRSDSQDEMISAAAAAPRIDSDDSFGDGECEDTFQVKSQGLSAHLKNKA